MTLSRSFIDDLVRRIRSVLEPDRVVLFGSYARGDATEDSDLDLLVIAPSVEPRWRRVVPLYQALAGIGAAKDVLWWTPEEIEAWRHLPTHVIGRALKEGKVIYERAA
jgi:uncharacterized protein